jgi:hypothetical protein
MSTDWIYLNFITLLLVSMSRTRGSIHPLYHTSSWHSTYFVKHRDNFNLWELNLIPCWGASMFYSLLIWYCNHQVTCAAWSATTTSVWKSLWLHRMSYKFIGLWPCVPVQRLFFSVGSISASESCYKYIQLQNKLWWKTYYITTFRNWYSSLLADKN